MQHVKHVTINKIQLFSVYKICLFMNKVTLLRLVEEEESETERKWKYGVWNRQPQIRGISSANLKWSFSFTWLYWMVDENKNLHRNNIQWWCQVLGHRTDVLSQLVLLENLPKSNYLELQQKNCQFHNSFFFPIFITQSSNSVTIHMLLITLCVIYCVYLCGESKWLKIHEISFVNILTS